ncbi:DUF4138 domain-containing protein [Pseudozobellia thermophila]|uniref:Bacteroides conjugative transposon TraN protein n=1 Tax=Pseudozobellia thermophila TaxID=192903 RepID=A0A1M6KVF2_9FLAO|nr:DUF4138 domain-containing protein [Pseudozobellia thermophila]SHJ62998.1 protein of unknown function [Pseudozobellia thermophila]
MKVPPIFSIIFIGCFLLVGNSTIMAQTPLAVACNDNSTVSLFFPAKVVKIVDPAVNFKFTYDESANLGTLQGRRGRNSNLTVITENGHIFSFNLIYSENVEKFNYILLPGQAVGKLDQGPVSPKEKVPETATNFQDTVSVDGKFGPPRGQEVLEVPEDVVVEEKTPTFSDKNGIDQENSPKLESMEFSDDGEAGVEQDLYDVDREEYYRIFCENNYLQKTVFKRSFRQNKRIVLKLNNILVDREEIYFVLQIENNSRREYHIDGVSFFKKTGVGQLQKIMKPKYTFNLQESLDPASVNEIVYVFEKFKLSSKELIYVALAEKDTDNMVILPLDNKQVNFPSN